MVMCWLRKSFEIVSEKVDHWVFVGERFDFQDFVQTALDNYYLLHFAQLFYFWVLEAHVLNESLNLLMRFGIKNRLSTVFFLFDFNLHIKIYDCLALVVYFQLCMVDFERLNTNF